MLINRYPNLYPNLKSKCLHLNIQRRKLKSHFKVQLVFTTMRVFLSTSENVATWSRSVSTSEVSSSFKWMGCCLTYSSLCLCAISLVLVPRSTQHPRLVLRLLQWCHPRSRQGLHQLCSNYFPLFFHAILTRTNILRQDQILRFLILSVWYSYADNWLHNVFHISTRDPMCLFRSFRLESIVPHNRHLCACISYLWNCFQWRKSCLNFRFLYRRMPLDKPCHQPDNQALILLYPCLKFCYFSWRYGEIYNLNLTIIISKKKKKKRAQNGNKKKRN